MAKELKSRYWGKNYSEPGYYFITITTVERHKLFGSVVGGASLQNEGEPHMAYSDFGEQVYQAIWEMPKVGVCAGKFRIDQFQIMPDHIHFLFRILEPLPIHLGELLSNFYTGCRTAFREVYGIPLEVEERKRVYARQHEDVGVRGTHPAQDKAGSDGAGTLALHEDVAVRGTHPTQDKDAGDVGYNGNIARALPYFGGTSFDPWGICSAGNGFAINLFAKGYNDWVVIKKGQLNAYFQYIKDNCRRYRLRELHPDLFKKLWGKELLPGIRFNMLGNMFLLQRPVKLQVRISRYVVEADCLEYGLEPRFPRYVLPKREKSEEDILKAIEPYLRRARKGAVLVTPAISPAEKQIVQAAYSQGLCVIHLLLQGMSEMHKPDGGHIDACAAGLLLELDPWGYDPTRKYTKPTCEALNDIAKALCQIGGNWGG